ncbi:uncharacterized protein LOC120672146 [Panicum virgatum]|uniref:Uncharacterized protein n=1 Tax=Panicum virgatum TaxID=38727 RepID=A0A8T0RMH5_PANVG|nr:uncharacterized protein LOC120672146 [Panicum virgatum]KAG2585923.1 hypothetical protein PVAP13_5NG010608 [Panicum virgatum]
MWPKATHGFFMHPPLLKSTAGGRRKNRMKSAMEGGNSRKKKHRCPICQELGHHWYICKNGNPEDIAAMEAVRGPPKKKLKKAFTCSTETSIVVPTPALGMVFPHNEVVANATHKKRKRTSSTKAGVTKRKGTATSTSTSTADTRSTRSGTGSNDPLPLQVLQPVPLLQDTGCPEATEHTVQTPRKKCAIKKKTYTKEGSCSCGSQPVQPRFKY